MSQQEIQYVACDAWLLLSIILAAANDDASLEEIVAIGDGINHAIFTENEMESGLYRLINGDYVEVMGNFFRPTPKAIEKYLLASKKTKTLRDQMDLLRQSIGATTWSFGAVADQTEISFKCSGFTRKRFREAVNSYLKNPSKVMEDCRIKRRPNDGMYRSRASGASYRTFECYVRGPSHP